MPTVNPNVAIMEFYPGPGGQEATIWADDLMNMYIRYANKVDWKVKGKWCHLDSTFIVFQ